METLPQLDECRAIILAVIKQAQADYVNYQNGSNISDADFATAEDMIFDSEYRLMWGEHELTMIQLCELVDIDLDGLHREVRKRCQKNEKVVGPRPTRVVHSFP